MEIVQRAPDLNQSRILKRFVLYSLALHVLFFFYLAIKSVLFPSTFQQYTSALRVDLVALPDQKKNDVVDLPKPADPKPAEPVVKSEPVAKPVAEPEDKGDYSTAKKKKAEHVKKEKEAQKKLKQALDRIRALERIKAMTSSETVKGNQISKGTSLTSEAKSSLEASYSDVVLERVRSNWELPRWLKDKGFSANVIVFIDARGGLKGLKFTKFSGNTQFDDEVKHTLQLSAPFSPPPEGTASDLSHEGIPLAFPL